MRCTVKGDCVLTIDGLNYTGGRVVDLTDRQMKMYEKRIIESVSVRIKKKEEDENVPGK